MVGGCVSGRMCGGSKAAPLHHVAEGAVAAAAAAAMVVVVVVIGKHVPHYPTIGFAL